MILRAYPVRDVLGLFAPQAVGITRGGTGEGVLKIWVGPIYLPSLGLIWSSYIFILLPQVSKFHNPFRWAYSRSVGQSIQMGVNPVGSVQLRVPDCMWSTLMVQQWAPPLVGQYVPGAHWITILVIFKSKSIEIVFKSNLYLFILIIYFYIFKNE